MRTPSQVEGLGNNPPGHKPTAACGQPTLLDGHSTGQELAARADQETTGLVSRGHAGLR